jgi:hypothetical protein
VKDFQDLAQYSSRDSLSGIISNSEMRPGVPGFILSQAAGLDN